ncbi:hypothetical protein Cantr_08059 [Candida viswanathii]|uniref:ATP-dependent RNA helicase n=1 Tax=Candida viswanathii TaxID=5486 RepID=A0A367Y561_9ASCO|nr:hypothetical protein Cantr_08059 [Candida viswanathii]
MFKQLYRSAIIRAVAASRVSRCASYPVLCARAIHISPVRKNVPPSQTTELPKEQETVKAESDGDGSPTFTAPTGETFTPVMFSDFKSKKYMHNTLVNAIVRAGFTKLTPIQQLALIPMLETKNGLVCRAKTGTGKTLAFAVPTMVNAMAEIPQGEKSVRTLVIAPTRDLALQIIDTYHKINDNLPASKRLKIGWAIGGMATKFDVRHPPEILVATPGRLEAEMRDSRRFAGCFSHLKYRVYDEADRLLDIGFEESLNRLDDEIQDVRDPAEGPLRSVLLSATIDDRVERFAKNHISPKYDFLNTVDPNAADVHEDVHQMLVQCADTSDKYEAAVLYLADVLKSNSKVKIIVFLPTKVATEWFYNYIGEVMESGVAGTVPRFRSYIIHGTKSAAGRSSALRGFQRFDRSILFATDVVGRGIDVKGVTHVIQVSPSTDTSSYVHKVGRTGRNGAKGTAVLFATDVEKPFIRQLKKDIKGEFDEVVKSYELKAERVNLFDKVRVPEDELTRLFSATASFYTMLNAQYKLDVNRLVEEKVKFYRSLLQDGEAKFDASCVKNMGRLDRRLLSQYFRGMSTHGSRRGGSAHGYDRYLAYGGNNRRSGYGNSRGNVSSRGRSFNRDGGYRRSNDYDRQRRFNRDHRDNRDNRDNRGNREGSDGPTDFSF